MAVSLVISETLDGSAISDSLEGGGTGVDIGSVASGSYGPLVSKTSNTGHQDIYVSHDGVNEITQFSVFIQEYGTGTGFTYGGADTAANDFTSLKNLGNASGSSKNNNDGLSGGLWIEMDADVVDASAFEQASRPTLVKIFGDSLTDGIDLGSAFLVKADSMVYNSSGEQQASSPVDGQIGPAGNTTLGDSSHLKFRLYLPTSHSNGGKLQWEVVFSYSFTS